MWAQNHQPRSCHAGQMVGRTSDMRCSGQKCCHKHNIMVAFPVSAWANFRWKGGQEVRLPCTRQRSNSKQQAARADREVAADARSKQYGGAHGGSQRGFPIWDAAAPISHVHLLRRNPHSHGLAPNRTKQSREAASDASTIRHRLAGRRLQQDQPEKVARSCREPCGGLPLGAESG